MHLGLGRHAYPERPTRRIIEIGRTGAQPPPRYLRTADLLAALLLASDLAVGLPAEHAVRTCHIATRLVGELDLEPRGITDADLIPGARIVTAANVVEHMAAGASSLSF